METVAPPSTNQGEDLKIDSNASKTSEFSMIYHIYHVGQEKRPRNYSIHTIKDGHTTILKPVKTSESKKDSKSHKSSITLSLQPSQSNQPEKPLGQSPVTNQPPSSTQNPSTNLENGTALAQVNSIPLKGIKKARLLDNPRHDPRSETAPYFLHLPRLALKEPPYTLRRAGHKRAPVACLMHERPLWQGWKIEYGDVLSQPGVIDGRGVVNIRFGTKNGKFEGEDGFLTGFKVPKRRWWGESGKKYWGEQKANGFEDNAHAEEQRMKPEEVVKLKWDSPFGLRTRDHVFEWRGFKFVWKGTNQIEEVRRAARLFVWCGHLKLIVQIPKKDAVEVAPGIRPPPAVLVLAKYACTMGNRKAGRLEVFQENVDAFLAEHILSRGADDVPEKNGTSTTASSTTEMVGDAELADVEPKSYQRLRDIIFSTALCMLISERDKRRFVLELLQEIGEVAGG